MPEDSNASMWKIGTHRLNTAGINKPAMAERQYSAWNAAECRFAIGQKMNASVRNPKLFKSSSRKVAI